MSEVSNEGLHINILRIKASLLPKFDQLLTKIEDVESNIILMET